MSVVATCCWCGARLQQYRILRQQVWSCPVEACFARCWRHAITYRQRSDKAKDGLGVERLFWLPLPRQIEALETVDRRAPRILFGGARGGGKSAFLRYLHYGQALKHENFHGLILRRKFPELEQTHIMRVRREAHLLGGTYRETTRIIEWPNGSITRFGHCQTDDDAENYLSAEYDLISFDELVTFPFGMAMRIISSLRSAGRADYTPQVVSGTNPGGPEAWWVRSMYIDREMDREEYPDYDQTDYAFIPSKLEDNPYLDKQYEKTLLALPPMLRKAYRDGSWDVWPGQYFPEWDRALHVAARDGWSPRGSRIYAGIDWGYIRPGCCLWVAIEPEGHAYVFDEYTFKNTITTDVAKEIKRRSKEWGVKPIYVADTQMWGGQDQTGEDMRETFARCGVALTQANKDRINGWQRLRAWLALAPDGKPWMQVAPRCVSLIRTLPSLQQDATHPEDVDCLVAGTMVTTPHGDVPIERVMPGDLVSTPVGPCRVLRSYLSGPSRTRYVMLDDGLAIRGTPNHPLYVVGRGMVPLSDIRYHDILMVGSISWSKLLSITALCIGVIRTGCSIFRTALSWLRGELACIVRCGLTREELSREGGTYTTWTGITTTTTSPTLYVSPQTSIADTTSLRAFVVRLDDNSRSGVGLELDNEPYETTQRRCARGLRVGHWRAEIVASLSLLNILARYFVAVNVSTKHLGVIGRYARRVVRSLVRVVVSLGPYRPVRIIAVGNCEDPEPVYNLTIDGAHLFYANGAISGNTDGDDHWSEALRYVCSARPAPGMTSAALRNFPVGSLGWLLNRDANKPKGLLSRRA